jgi:hypothetical protein
VENWPLFGCMLPHHRGFWLRVYFRTIISSTRSSQVLCISLDAAMVLRGITPHDREGSEVSFHARHERALFSRENKKD